MLYKHKFFSLDTNSRQVFDEHNKELRLTGNAYRVLVFLCANKQGTVTDIGDFLDREKDYSEDHIRQYRYKINTIIGHDVVVYKNGIYLLGGDVSSVEKTEENGRNTDLLHSNKIKSEQNHMAHVHSKLEFYRWPAIVSSIVLFLSVFPMPYGFYTITKIIVTASSIYYAYYLYRALRKKGFWFWCFVAVAILFNPIMPIYLYNKTLWGAIDFVVIGLFVIFIFKQKK
ncbi:MAG: hypothetical protein HYT31_02830 [Parcubacteria group bacterium]|nr:hypothetical protein [Parcubacteria group bacterium]